MGRECVLDWNGIRLILIRNYMVIEIRITNHTLLNGVVKGFSWIKKDNEGGMGKLNYSCFESKQLLFN